MAVVGNMAVVEQALLIECFTEDGESRGLYWNGQTNQVRIGERGLEVTRAAGYARRIPVRLRDIADELADTINKAIRPTSTDVWRAMEHTLPT